MDFFCRFKHLFGLSKSKVELVDELDQIESGATHTPRTDKPFKQQAENIMSAQEMSKAKTPKQENCQVNPHLSQALIDDIVKVITAHLNNSNDESSAQQIASLQEKLTVSEAKRQALQVRNNDLSAKVTTMTGEIEHLDIERRSLLNKIKVMQVRATNGEKNANDGNENHRQQAEIEQITEEFKEKMDISRALIDDLRKDAAAKAQEIEELKSKLSNGSPLENQLQERLQAKDAEINSLKAEIKEANNNMEMVHEIEQKLNKFAEYKEKKERETEMLTQQVNEAREREEKSRNEMRTQLELSISEKNDLQKQIDMLKNQINDTAEKHNRRDIGLANYIDELKNQLNATTKKAQEDQKCTNELIELVDNLEKQTENLTKERNALDQTLKETQKALSLEREATKRQEKKIKTLQQQAEQRITLIDNLHKKNEASQADAEKKSNETTSAAIIKENETNRHNAAPATEVSNNESETENTNSLDELDDIDWLTPGAPPTPSTPQPATNQQHDQQQLSLF